MKDYCKLLPTEWAKIFTDKTIKDTFSHSKNSSLNPWTEELLKLTKPGDTVLEIGCGSGATSFALSSHGRICTALDYSEEIISSISKYSQEMHIPLKTIVCDATKVLPFPDNAFDYSFQAGLLEHFSIEESIALLKEWGRVSKKMVSLVPNAASLPYRLGKSMMEANGTWRYGIELPRYTLIHEMSEAGFRVINEYTISPEWSLRFIPDGHPWRIFFKEIFESGFLDDHAGQGYLLVTYAEKIIH